LRQATSELEGQLKLAVAQLSEYKLRAANAESSLSSLASDAIRVNALEKEVRDKNATIAKLRHDGELER
jgi:predicted  nucleic acid-binding Zn-ribbon protein